MVADDSVLVQRGTEHFNATYDGTSWDKIRDSDLLLAWDGTKNRKVTGQTFKELFSTPEIPFAIYRKFCGTGSIKTSCGNTFYYGKGRANIGSLQLDHWLYQFDSNSEDIKEKVTGGSIKFPVYVSNSVYPTYKLEGYEGFATSECTLLLGGSTENEWKVPWSGDNITDGYIIKLHESADVPFLEWNWIGSDSAFNPGGADLPSAITPPYVYFAYNDLLEYDVQNPSANVARTVFDNVNRKNSDIWLKIDNGPAVYISNYGHAISTDNGKISLREDNYIYSSSLLKFFYYMRPSGKKIKFYQHDPDRDKTEFKGIYYVKTEGMTYGTGRIRRLDYNGNLTTSGTAYGIFIPLDVLHDRDRNGNGLHNFHPWANFKDLNGATALWSGSKPKILDVKTMDGMEGIRIVGNNSYENSKPGTMIYGLNLTRD